MSKECDFKTLEKNILFMRLNNGMSNLTIEKMQQREAIVNETRALLEKYPNGWDDQETEQRYVQMNMDIDRLDKEIKVEERKEHQNKLEDGLKAIKRETRTAPHRLGVNTEMDERRSFNAWIRNQCGMAVSYTCR
jgi:hypothetical protein